MICVERVSRRFGTRVAVDDLSFEVRRGEVFGLLGPNGAGKTTTLRMIGGLIPPTSGTIAIDGRTFTRASSHALRSRIGFLTETPGLWEALTVEDNLLAYARLFSVPRPEVAVDQVLRRFGLADRRTDRAGVLSKGMKQKVALARALVHEPDIVLLDEPTANLDPETSRTVRDMLRQIRGDGRAVVISTHNLDEVERLADRVGLVNGRLVAMGEPAALRREVFGGRVRVRFATGSAASTFAAVAERAGAADVRVEREMLSMVLESPDQSVPALVRALVDAGADIREVLDEQRPLEDVYLALLSHRDNSQGPSPNSQGPTPKRTTPNSQNANSQKGNSQDANAQDANCQDGNSQGANSQGERS